MPICIICNREFITEKALNQHAKDKKDEKHTHYRTQKRKDLLKTLAPLEKFSSVGIEPINITHIPIHDEPEEKRKSNLACKALRNLNR
ncbi:MAG: hypothetical protein Q7J35_05300 [Candidatus Methanoperedens sp.]|nr:hypothetical protein [Candidatus Methanoperedens sp.]